MFSSFRFASPLVAAALLLASPAVASAQSQTAQSVMVHTVPESTAYQIEGTITWTYDRDEAETNYTNAWDGNPPVVTEGTGAVQTSPGAPAPDPTKLLQHAQRQRCIFFFGGSLSGDTYTQTVNGTKGWKWTYTFNITPNIPAVDAKTAWSSKTTGDGTVDVDFAGFVASESYLRQANNRTKYSFTLLDSLGLSRVQNVSAQLQWMDGGGNWLAVGDPLVSESLDVTATTEDYEYAGNAGTFGNAAVFGALHTAPTKVSDILLADNFANNNTDLANGNVHQANYGGTFSGLTEAGDYQIVVSGVVKGNSATANQAFSVTSELIVVGGCTLPE